MANKNLVIFTETIRKRGSSILLFYIEIKILWQVHGLRINWTFSWVIHSRKATVETYIPGKFAKPQLSPLATTPYKSGLPSTAQIKGPPLEIRKKNLSLLVSWELRFLSRTELVSNFSWIAHTSIPISVRFSVTVPIKGSSAEFTWIVNFECVGIITSKIYKYENFQYILLF